MTQDAFGAVAPLVLEQTTDIDTACPRATSTGAGISTVKRAVWVLALTNVLALTELAPTLAIVTLMRAGPYGIPETVHTSDFLAPRMPLGAVSQTEFKPASAAPEIMQVAFFAM
jgi:hypothetical protein